jgi:hypothetical protein
MRKYFKRIIISVLFLLSVNLFAQRSKSLWIDAKVGVNNIWIMNQNAYGNPEMNYATSFGFTESLGVSYFVTDQWAFGTSVGLTKIGQNYSGIQSMGEADRKVNLLYIELPLMLMRKLSMGYNNPTWLALGPDFMILARANQEYSRTGGDPLPNPEGMAYANITNRFKPVDIAIRFAINQMYGLEFENSDKLNFLLSLNSAIGLTDINSQPYQTENTHNDYSASHNFYVGLKAGIMFRPSRY